MKRIIENKSNEKGFTLIELLIVIIILGILAAIVVFAVGDSTSNAAEKACKTDFKTVSTASEREKADTGSYSSTTPAQLKTKGYLKDDVTSDKYTLTISAGQVVVNGGTPGDITECESL